jgi:HAD superfamily phosphatase (TIGR01668 family)
MKKSGAIHTIIGVNPLLPDYLLDSILSLTPKLFKDSGITHLVFDVDGTLVPKKGMVLTNSYREHLIGLRKSGLKIYIGSNAHRDLSPMAKSIGAGIIPPTRLSFKPFRSYFQRISKAINTSPKHTAMIGDRIVNDIVGANRAGFTTVLVSTVVSIKKRPAWWRRFYLDWVLKRVG